MSGRLRCCGKIFRRICRTIPRACRRWFHDELLRKPVLRAEGRGAGRFELCLAAHSLAERGRWVWTRRGGFFPRRRSVRGFQSGRGLAPLRLRSSPIRSCAFQERQGGPARRVCAWRLERPSGRVAPGDAPKARAPRSPASDQPRRLAKRTEEILEKRPVVRRRPPQTVPETLALDTIKPLFTATADDRHGRAARLHLSRATHRGEGQISRARTERRAGKAGHGRRPSQTCSAAATRRAPFGWRLDFPVGKTT